MRKTSPLLPPRLWPAITLYKMPSGSVRKGAPFMLANHWSFVRHVSWKPLSRVEGASPHARKPPGHSLATPPQWGVCRRQKWQVNVKAKDRASPRPPSCPYEVRKAAAYVWRLWLQRRALNLHTRRKLPSAKSPLVFLCGFRCSRNVHEMLGHFCAHGSMPLHPAKASPIH